MEAVGQEAFARLLAKKDWGLIAAFRSKLIDLLKQYYYVGGMPEVVNAFINHKDYAEVRQLQQTILDSYDRDFSKHAPIAEVPRIRMIWRSVPAQLAKENKKFIYGVVKEGARAKDFELAIEWLIDAGLIYKVSRVKKPESHCRLMRTFRHLNYFVRYRINGSYERASTASVIGGECVV